MRSFYSTLVLLLCFSSKSFSQISVSGAPADALVNDVLSGNSIVISNVQYYGSPFAIGYFSGSTANIPFENGLLMTTGQIHQILGPNDADNSGVDNGFGNSSAQLTQLSSGSVCYNGATITFDFVPSGNNVTLEYIFGSEEYPEYVGTQYSDVFGIFLSGPGITGIQNIATLPNGNPISINTINNGNPTTTPPGPASNPSYFVSNGIPLIPPYTTDSIYIEYDGFTVPLTTSAPVTPMETYHLEISIADVGDGIFDSGVLFNAHSLTAVINENDFAGSFEVSPNPVEDVLSIEFNQQLEYFLAISDISGKVISTRQLLQHTSISFADLPSGVYFLTISDGANRCVKKVVKQ